MQPAVQLGGRADSAQRNAENALTKILVPFVGHFPETTPRPSFRREPEYKQLRQENSVIAFTTSDVQGKHRQVQRALFTAQSLFRFAACGDGTKNAKKK